MSETRGEKRPLVQQNSILDGITAVLIDLEGVSTPNSYINEGFISHVKENFKKFLEEHYDEESTKSLIESLRKSNGKIPDSSDKAGVVSAVFALVEGGLGSDDAPPDQLHSPILEAFWTEAYKKEDIQGDLYEDVVPLIKVLTSNEAKVISYSCSSVALQKLFYANSNQGNISELYSDFLVRKKKAKSNGSEVAKEVEKLAKEHLKLALNNVLYITHSLEASKAAGELGMKSCFVLRDVGEDITEEQLQSVHVISNLDELTEDDFDDDDDDEEDDIPPVKRGRVDDGEYDDDDGDEDNEEDNEDDEDGEEEEEEEEEE